METALVMGKPAPCVRACVDAVDEAMRAQTPSHGLSTMPRAWRAWCVTAGRRTHSLCWARCARASLGTSALAAWSWMLRHRTMPWESLLVARVRVILRQEGLTSGRRARDETDNPRAQSAQTRAPRSPRRDTARGGSLWGHSLVLLVVVTPTLSLPVGVVFSPPAPALRAWEKKAKALTKPGGPPQQRPPTGAPSPGSHHTTTRPALPGGVQGAPPRSPEALSPRGGSLWHGTLCR
jgi:hypothetical protein